MGACRAFLIGGWRMLRILNLLEENGDEVRVIIVL